MAVRRIAKGFLATRSVAARSAIRTGCGIGIGRSYTHAFPIQHGIGVVLGVIMVLGSSALTTGTKVQPMTDGPDGVDDPIQMSIVSMLNSAQRRAWLTAGYFGPTNRSYRAATGGVAGR